MSDRRPFSPSLSTEDRSGASATEYEARRGAGRSQGYSVSVFDHTAAAEESDHELVIRAQAGDNEAFDQLMVRHQRAILALMRRYSTHSGTVEELAQTVFVKAYMNLAGYRAAAPFLSWLRVIAARVGYDFWRDEKKNRPFRSEGDMDSFARKPQPTGAEHTAFEQLSQVLARLDPAEKQVLFMLHVDGLSIRTIASTMGWNLSMTKMRAFRARNKLRKILRRSGEREEEEP